MAASELKQPFANKITGNLVPAFISLAALAATFLISNLNLTFTVKLLIFTAIMVSYTASVAFLYFRQQRKISSETAAAASDSTFGGEVEAKLFALDEARQFFSASLKSADMFRLVASRLNEIIPFSACILFLANEEKSILKSQFAVGENTKQFADLRIVTGKGLAGRALAAGAIQTDGDLSEDRKMISAKILDKMQSGIAAPLFRDGEIFGVLVLYGDLKKQFAQTSASLIEAVAVRVAPLFLSSQSFENNLTNALIDPLTRLPNERALYLILENQIAEAQRFRGKRPLAVLALDIENFNEINLKFGHAVGDRVIGFAAEIIKNQLRKMDFLARSAGDEFLAVLPTASDATVIEISERVRKIFVLSPFEVSERETLNLQVRFGAASFAKDGETATALIQTALLKKKQSKHQDGANKILFFPKEFIN